MTGASGGSSPVEVAARRLDRSTLAPVVNELARRLGRGEGFPRRITLRGLDVGTRTALADLLGLATLPSAQVRLEVAAVARALGLDRAEDLVAVVEALRGTLGNRAAERVAEADARNAVLAWFERRCGEVTVPGVGPLQRWPKRVRRDGVRGGPAAFRARFDRVFAVLEALDRVPGGGMPLASFANLTLGDSHGLDPGRAEARLVVTAIADAAGQDPPDSAEDVRRTWELVRVDPDPLSSTVLTVGLRTAASHPLGSLLGHHALAAEPVVMTLSQLRRWPLVSVGTDGGAGSGGEPGRALGSGPELGPGSQVYVVENPALVAMASAQRWNGPPIVCSSGRPSIAVLTLLRQLGAGGATVYQHADFDAAGLDISRWLARYAGTIPWRMTADDYRRAVEVDRDRPPISGPLPVVAWDPDLASVMTAHGHAVHEEEVAAELLASMKCR